MATLHLPKGKTYVPKRKASEISVPTRRGHAAASSYFDQFKKRPSNGQRARPPGVKSVGPFQPPSTLPDPYIKRKNTPLGAPVKPARLANIPKDQFNLSWWALPRKVAMDTAVNIVRKELNLKPDRLAHPVSTVDASRLKPVKPRPRKTELERLRAKAVKALRRRY